MHTDIFPVFCSRPRHFKAYSVSKPEPSTYLEWVVLIMTSISCIEV
jgi:hypothetical protein